MRRDRHTRRGWVAVESAFMIVVFMLFCLGTLDFGQFLYFHQSLAERARAAARYGAVNWTDRTAIQNVAIYNDPAGAANGATAIMPNLTAAMVDVCLPGDTACSDPANTVDSRITVTISGYQMIRIIFPRSFTNKPITASLPSERPFS